LSGGRLGNVNPLIYTLSAMQTLAGAAKAPEPLQFFLYRRFDPMLNEKKGRVIPGPKSRWPTPAFSTSPRAIRRNPAILEPHSMI